MILAPADIGIEMAVVNTVLWLKLGIEATGAVVIAMGVAAAGLQFMRSVFAASAHDFGGIRLTLARYLALALEFALGADILATAVAPSWDQIGKLGAIAVIRTALNYFLTREMHDQSSSLEKTT